MNDCHMFVVALVLICMFPLLLLAVTTAEPFDLELAKGQLLIAYSSYCRPELITQWNCYWCTFPQAFNVTVVKVVYNSQTHIQGFVGIYKDNRKRSTIGVAMRGTVMLDPVNWLHNIDFRLVSYDGSKTVKVHSGFLSDFQSVYLDIRGGVFLARQRCPTCKRLVVTGHSLGGALATLVALDLKKAFPGLDIVAYTFGSPRVGNADLASFYGSQIGTTWRTTNNNDIVPHLPPQLASYHHVATEVWERNTGYTVCNSSGEDPSCADSVKIPSITDHFLYMQTDLRLGRSHCTLWPSAQ